MQPREAFVAARRGDWDELDALLRDDRDLHRLPPAQISRAASLYRSLCADLMRARAAGYEIDLVRFLDGLAARAHNALYAARPYRLRAIWELVARDFPRTLRARLPFVVVAAFLFCVPAVVGFVGAYASPAFAGAILPEDMLVQMEESYAKGFSGRDSGQDTMMAGFYVYNNVGIAFRCFATGILAGVGSLFFLLYNGLMIGTVFGHVWRAGYGHHILTFTCGHSGFELGAIVISGAAGLQMGYALIATDGRSRLASLRAQARPIANLILGAALMLGIAALLEGFWSPSSAPPAVKGVAAVLFAVGLLAYFAFAGRGAREP